MWSAVAPDDAHGAAPSSRAKHSATVFGEYVYILGGRNGNIPLKDFWKYNLVTGKWKQLKPTGDLLPCLQEHTAVTYKDNIYVFGGEISFSASTETPLWVYDVRGNSWKKVKTKKGVATPKGRRGHTALVHNGSMLIYGGYQDLRGSCGELWSFHFETGSWHLISFPSDQFPPPRHKHSAVIHGEAMWIYGGMTDLLERGDYWKWDFYSKMWTNIKSKINPGPLHSHACCKMPSSMIIFGGERSGQSSNDLWKFNFDMETWEKITISGLKPQSRSESRAFIVSELLLKGSSKTSLEAKTVRIRARTSNSADRGNRHSSYLPNNRVAPCENTYIFEPSQLNYIDGSSLAQQYSDNSRTSKNSFLQEISKLSQLNISRVNKHNYTILPKRTSTDSTESLLRQHSSPQQEVNTTLADSDIYSTPSRVFKKTGVVNSENEHIDYTEFFNEIRSKGLKLIYELLVVQPIIKNKFGCCWAIYLSSQDIVNEKSFNTSSEKVVARSDLNTVYGIFIEANPSTEFQEKDSGTMIKSKSAHVIKKKYTDSSPSPEEEVKETSRKKRVEFDCTIKKISRDPISVPNFSILTLPTPVLTPVEASKLVYLTDEETYIGSEVPINRLITEVEPPDDDGFENRKPLKRGDSYSSHLGYADNPLYHEMISSLQKNSEENVSSTSDYCSLETVNRLSSASSYSVKTNTPQEEILRNKENIKEGPFGFCNPNYMGPAVKSMLTTEEKKAVSKMLSNDHSEVKNPDEEEVLELLTYDGLLDKNTKVLYRHSCRSKRPVNLPLKKHIKQTSSNQVRAHSAGRAERNKSLDKKCNENEVERIDSFVPLYVYIIGGKEQGHVTVFQRPISMWRLKLF